MKCNICAEACCETIEVYGQQTGDDFPQVTEQWLTVRACGRTRNGGYLVEAICPKLHINGSCTIHEEDSYPLSCALYAVGGEDCINAIRAVRSAEQYATIRDEDDPEVL